MERKLGKRTIYVDVLRIVAMLMVVVIHVSASNWHGSDVQSFEWKTFNVFDSMVRSAVPIFVMISGMFFLNPGKPFNLSALYKKSILRLAIAYVFWSIAYAVFMFYYKGLEWNENSISWLIDYTLNEHNILWYIPMLIGVYILIPVLRPITATKNKKLLEYILWVFFIFGILIRTVNKFDINENLLLVLNKIQLDGFVAYVGYFLLGYYLFTYDFKKKWRIVIYILGIVSVFVTIFVGQHFALEANKPGNILYGYHMLTTFFEGMAIIVFIKSSKYIASLSEKQGTSKVIVEFSALTFGMYLIHDMVLRVFLKLGFTTIAFNPILAVSSIIIAVFVVSAILVFILRKIPFVKKYLM